MNIFDKIYSKNKWLFGSGEGSLEKYTKSYRVFLEKFIKDHGVQSVLDFGCGDWQFSRHINWNGANYQGVDIVETVIRQNQKKYQSDNIKFSLISENYEPEPADLFIAKDVFQHWSSDRILNFLPQLKKFKYVLITNCGDIPSCRNADIQDGGFRTIDLSSPPFSLAGKYIFSFRTRGFSIKNMVKWILPHYLKGLDFNNKKVFFIDNTLE